MPLITKPAVRTLITLRKQLDALEADVVENRRRAGVASADAIGQLGVGVGDERLVKFAGETWRLHRDIDGVKVLALTIDEDI